MMGQRDLRRLLITGAMAVVRHAARRGSAADPWLTSMLMRKPRMLVAIALAAIIHEQIKQKPLVMRKWCC